MALKESLEAKVNIFIEEAVDPPVLSEIRIEPTNGDVKIIVKATDI